MIEVGMKDSFENSQFDFLNSNYKGMTLDQDNNPRISSNDSLILDRETILLMISDFLHTNNCEQAVYSLEGELRQIICHTRLLQDLPSVKSSLLDGDFNTTMGILGTYYRSHSEAVKKSRLAVVKCQLTELVELSAAGQINRERLIETMKKALISVKEDCSNETFRKLVLLAKRAK